MVGQIQIHSVPARIGLNIVHPRLDVKVDHPGIELAIQEPRITIVQRLPKVQIDQYPSRASAGIKGIQDRATEFSQQSQEAALEAIALIAGEGDRLRAIENPADPIPELAEQALGIPEYPEFILEFIPSVPPEIHVEMETHPVQIQVQDGSVQNRFRWGRVGGEFHRGSVDVYLLQKNSLTITPPAVNIQI